MENYSKTNSQSLKLYYKKFKYLTYLLLILNVDCILCREKEENVDAKLVLTILKKEDIKYCLFSTNMQQWANWTVSDFKHFTKNGIFTVFMKQETFDYYLESNVKKIRLGAVVVKTDELQYWCNYHNDEILYRTILANVFFIIIDTTNKELLNKIKKYDATIPYNSKFVLATQHENENYDIMEIYKNTAEGVHNLNIYGQYDEKSGLNATKRKFYERRFDLNGSTLIGKSHGLGCVHRIICTGIDIWELFGTMMNFRSFYYDEFGQLDAEDTVLNPHILYNQDGINYVGPIFKTIYSIYVKDTFEEDQSLRTYTMPFSDQLWIYITVWTVGLSIFHVLIMSIQKFFEELEMIQDIHSIILSPFDYLMGKSDINLSYKTSTRIVLLLTTFIALVISSSYTATFFLFIMIKKPKFPFTDLDSFIKDGTYKLAATEKTFLYRYFQISSDPKIKIINEKFLHDVNDRVADVEEGTYRLCKDKKFAYACLPPEIYKYRHSCKILNIPTSIFEYHTIMKLGNPSPYREIFNQNLMTVRSSGVLKKIVSLIETQTWKTVYDTKTEVDLATIAPVLLLTSYIYVASFVMLIVEMIVFLVKCNEDFPSERNRI